MKGMDKAGLIELVPHYIAMLLLLFLLLAVIRALLGEMNFWIELLVALSVAFAYRPIVQRLGVAPSVWETDQ